MTRTPKNPPPHAGIRRMSPGIAGFDESYWNDGYWNNGYWRRRTLAFAGSPAFTTSPGSTNIQTITVIASWPPTDIGQAVVAVDEDQVAAI